MVINWLRSLVSRFRSQKPQNVSVIEDKPSEHELTGLGWANYELARMMKQRSDVFLLNKRAEAAEQRQIERNS